MKKSFATSVFVGALALACAAPVAAQSTPGTGTGLSSGDQTARMRDDDSGFDIGWLGLLGLVGLLGLRRRDSANLPPPR
jgi:hypothetical protein